MTYDHYFDLDLRRLGRRSCACHTSLLCFPFCEVLQIRFSFFSSNRTKHLTFDQ